MKKYIIKAVNQKGNNMYLESKVGVLGGKKYNWTSEISFADFFDNQLDAENLIKSDVFQKKERVVMGKILPSDLLSEACEFRLYDNINQKGFIDVSVCELTITEVSKYHIDAEVKIPKNIIYEY